MLRNIDGIIDGGWSIGKGYRDFHLFSGVNCIQFEIVGVADSFTFIVKDSKIIPFSGGAVKFDIEGNEILAGTIELNKAANDPEGGDSNS